MNIVSRVLLSAGWVWAVVLVGCGDDAGAAAQADLVSQVDVIEGEGIETADASLETTVEVAEPAAEVAEVAETIAEVAETAGPDAVGPLPGFGVITGDCEFVAGELDATDPSLYVNRIDFGSDPYDAGDLAFLTDGGREILDDGNAGGSSILSEVFAFEMLARCDGAVLLKTENEIVYDTAAKITDMVVEIAGRKVGANPTRAVGFPFDAPYTTAQARTILEKKLGDIVSSSASVSAEDRWVKQVLTVFAYSEDHVAPVQTAWNEIDPTLRADTIVIVTVTDGDDRFIYSNN